MSQNRLGNNPFTVQTPEDLPARETLDLFVDVFTDFAKVRDIGHCMVNGPRGCGKSMMFRYLLPDCQTLLQDCQINSLPFFAILVSIKNTNLNLTELQRLVDRHANIVINEHFLTMYVASRLFATLTDIEIEDSAENRAAVHRFYKEEFVARLRLSGWTNRAEAVAKQPVKRVFAGMRKICDNLYSAVISYVKHQFFATDIDPYIGPLCGYLDFLFPLLEALRGLPFMPRAAIYLLLDDADCLNTVQKKILNSWIATRTSATVSIKVSTQLQYETFTTISRSRIASPHDYQEINIFDLYTTSRGKYLARVREIVLKRLTLAGLDCTPEDFFPPDKEQEAKIQEIATQLRADWQEHVHGHGYRPSDDVVRYARPTFVASLKGQSKSGSTYSYAGFVQLVHISSGLIRYFLEPAAMMFSEQQSLTGQKPVTDIEPRIQNDIIRTLSNDLMLGEFEKLFTDDGDGGNSSRDKLLTKKRNLQNLLKALGGVFHEKLISNDSERRVFSVAVSDGPDPDILEVFQLGLQFGYFQRSSIGNKDGTGRTPLFVLTRRLAPYFSLDPSGFAGYLFVTNERLREAIANPESFLRRVKERGVAQYFDERQLQLFE